MAVVVMTGAEGEARSGGAPDVCVDQVQERKVHLLTEPEEAAPSH